MRVLFTMMRIKDAFNEMLWERVALKCVSQFFQIVLKAIFSIVYFINTIKKCFDETGFIPK